MIENRSEDRHPFVSLLYLLFFCLLGSVLFTIIAVFVCFFIYGEEALTAITGGITDTNILKIFQTFSSVGTFIVPSFFFAKNAGERPAEYLEINKPLDFKLAILASAIVFVASAFIEWTIEINQLMKLPDSLKKVEDWMKTKEFVLERLTKQLLVMKGIPDLLINLFVIAVIPAIGEELIFRGCIQKVLSKWARNPHVGIWASAVIFSAIHVQFYGFIPRMILGALFGYLFYWSKNLWIPIIAHFINNGTAVVGAYLMQKRGESIEMIDKPQNTPLATMAMSILFTSLLSFAFYKLVKREAVK